MAQIPRESVREILNAHLAGKGLRKTSQRDAIIEAAFGTNEHYTAEELLVMARGIDRSVSRATVYRTLPILVESGLLRELDLGEWLFRNTHSGRPWRHYARRRQPRPH